MYYSWKTGLNHVNQIYAKMELEVGYNFCPTLFSFVHTFPISFKESIFYTVGGLYYYNTYPTKI